MIIPRILILRTTIGLGAALCCCWTLASDPWPIPRPIAEDTPAFQAPEEPPRGDEASEDTPPPEPEGPLEMHDALALALMQNPELQMFSWEVRAGEARALQAGKWSNPELDLRWYRLGIPRANRQPDERRQRVIVSQDFPLGGDPGKRRVLAQVATDLAGWDYEAKRIEVASAVTSRFTTVLAAQRRAESATELVQFLDEMLNTVSALVETGAMRSLEVHQITRQLGLARIDQQQADSELFASRFQLAATWGSVSPRFAEAVGELEPIRSIPEIETVIELAQRSPSIARWNAELARGQAALSLAKARRIPNLRVGAGIRWEETVNAKDYLVDVEIALPILDRKQGEIREARHRMARAEAGRRAAEAATSQGIAEFYYDLAESRSRALTLRDEVVPASRAAVEAYRLGFEVGPENLEDLLEARRELAWAEIKYVDALADYHRALANLEGIVGEELAGSP